ncbi:hypothetical protein KJK41_19345 [Bacillus haikouensis]|nr:hypothetical protein KJK41_19345 [Bacillus haikouensis]
MIADFSEFTYGFALTRELLNLSSRIVPVAPVFPSLIQEGRQGGGYDVGIDFPGYPLFIQFKLSEHMKSKNSKEWHVYNAPYYRFGIRPPSKSNQHALLLHLEQSQKNVFYAAPAFSKTKEINKAFIKNQIASKSVFVLPSSIGNITDNKEHNVVFQPQSNFGYFCSDPKKIEVNNSSTFIDKLFSNFDEKTHIEQKSDFIELGKELLIIASEVMGNQWGEFAKNYLYEIPNRPEQVVSYFSRIFFNCDFYMVKEG